MVLSRNRQMKPTYRPSRPNLGFWKSLMERIRFYIWVNRI